jgi:hypothetical protein
MQINTAPSEYYSYNKLKRRQGNMLRIFNENAGAIQAIASVMSVFVTLVLVLITAKYVKLTHDIAKTAQDSLEEQKEMNQGKKQKDY